MIIDQRQICGYNEMDFMKPISLFLPIKVSGYSCAVYEVYGQTLFVSNLKFYGCLGDYILALPLYKYTMRGDCPQFSGK